MQTIRVHLACESRSTAAFGNVGTTEIRFSHCWRCPGTTVMRGFSDCILFHAMSLRSHALRQASALWRCIHLLYVSTEAIVAYSAPKGGNMKSMAGGARFQDLTYDGNKSEHRYWNGLGQLTDSLVGPNDFELPDPSDTAGKLFKTFCECISLLYNC